MFKKNPFFFLIFLGISLCFLGFGSSVYAQDKQPVSGMVVSNENKEPLSGVSILWKNKGVSSRTNEEGKFRILLPGTIQATDSLVFSCIGYTSERLSIPTALNVVNLTVELHKSVQNLQEVVIKRLSLKQLLDSIILRNNAAFVSPVKLNGYYRELVFTNGRRTAYADALCAYYYGHAQPEGQLQIIASRCIKETKVNEDKNNMEVYRESKIDPNLAFKYALFSGMIEKYFPGKNLDQYRYILEQSSNPQVEGIQVTVLPNAGAEMQYYKLTLLMQNDYTLKSYLLEIPENLLTQVKEKSILGIHAKATQLRIEVSYTQFSGHIYPNYYSIAKAAKVWGKMMGASIDQTMENKSEFVVTEFSGSAGLKGFTKQEVYKKGNICDNGIAISDELLKNYTILLPNTQ